jgi:drug/metabolite transporter (DMT)-like permease
VTDTLLFIALLALLAGAVAGAIAGCKGKSAVRPGPAFGLYLGLLAVISTTRAQSTDVLVVTLVFGAAIGAIPFAAAFFACRKLLAAVRARSGAADPERSQGPIPQEARIRRGRRRILRSRDDPMSFPRIFSLTLLTMIAFAGNSLLCRVALKHTGIDAASFTLVRLLSGAVVLYLVARLFRAGRTGKGNWLSASALFAYAAGFSFAYGSLPAGTGALLLFGAVQATMIGRGIWRGERLHGLQLAGLVLALGGLVGLVLPGVSAPPPGGSLLMLGAGIAWGVYSLRGRGTGDPTWVTAGNFLRAVPLAAGLSLLLNAGTRLDGAGVGYAVASGALASGIGYAVWYSVLPALKATNAATVQLSVPVIAAIGGIVFLGEPLTLRLVAASVAILGGIGLVILVKQDAQGIAGFDPRKK